MCNDEDTWTQARCLDCNWGAGRRGPYNSDLTRYSLDLHTHGIGFDSRNLSGYGATGHDRFVVTVNDAVVVVP